MSQHTPGPWHAVANGGDDDDERLRIIVARDRYGDSSAIGEVYDPDPCNGDIEANARLIAAAPELLEACKQAAVFFEDDEGIAQVLLAAIAKATQP